MAVYDGFFDAVANEETGEFDRAYGSGNFTDYFAHIIGSGVCIHNAPDSFKVRFENGAAVVSPGYLFIEGYWLKNDEDYTISVTGDATLAIVAHLNLGRRMIELEARSVAQAYPDSLVLALVNPSAGTAEDTRHNTDICGTIDTAGELSKKVEWAVNYIDNEIEDKLAAAEADIAEQSKKLDAKIAEVQAQVDKITPPPVGSIKFSASEDVGPGWLPCNGDFISESQYPELVAALGKLTPSGDKFKLISDGEIGPQISNGVVYGGRMWVYSYSTKKLYGVDLDAINPVKEIELTGDADFNNWLIPSTDRPIALSIVPLLSSPGQSKLCLAQYVGSGYSTGIHDTSLEMPDFLIYWSDFSDSNAVLSMVRPFSTTINLELGYQAHGFVGGAIPYVTSRMIAGIETFYCLPCGGLYTEVDTSSLYYTGYLTWTDTENESAKLNLFSIGVSLDTVPVQQILSFNKKNQNEMLFSGGGSKYNKTFWISSLPDGYFNQVVGPEISNLNLVKVRASSLYGGNSYIVMQTSPDISGGVIVPRSKPTAPENVQFNLSVLPSAKRLFIDAGAYLWGKDIYMIFVGTGIIFSRTLEEGSFGYLDTTSVLGTITQFGYLDYSQDEGTLYLLGQDTSNRVKVAKIVLNTLYDYANDGTWLPMIAADGVPAWIKAVGENGGGNITDPVDIKITVSSLSQYADILFNGDALLTTGSFTRTVSENGTFTVGLRSKTSLSRRIDLRLNNSVIATIDTGGNNAIGTEKIVTLKRSDYIADGITLRAD